MSRHTDALLLLDARNMDYPDAVIEASRKAMERGRIGNIHDTQVKECAPMLEHVTLRRAIELAITTEELGADFYQHLEDKFKENKELKDIFGQLARDEKTHEAQFKKLLEKAPTDDNREEHYESYQYLRATSISEFFSGDGFADIEKIEERDQALGKALAFEKSTLQYYKAMEEILGDEPLLKEIIAAERRHVVAIMKVITTGAKFRGTEYDG
jgi:rubrerythrin